MRRLVALSALALAVTSARGDAWADANGSSPPPPAAAASRPRAAPASMTKLSNGLTLIIEEDHRAPVVSMELRYGIGSKDDPKNHPGLALLVQRMMVTATAHVPESAYYDHLERIGASSFSQSTSADYTDFWATVPAGAVPTVLWLWSDQMGFFVPRVDQALLDKQRDVVKSERHQNVDNAPYGAVRELARQALYPDSHPYHATELEGGLDGVNVRDVKTFFDQHYGPNAAVLSIVGDVDEAKTIELVKKWFGAIGPAPALQTDADTPDLKREVRLDVSASVQEPVVVMNWHTPRAFAPGAADLDAVARVLSGRRVALLHWALVDQRKISTQVTARQNVRALGSDFEIWASVARGQSADDVISTIDQVLESYRTNGLPGDRFQHALNEAWLPRAFSLEHPAARASRYADYFLARMNPNSFEVDFSRFDRVTPESAQKAAQKWLDPKRRVVTVVSQDPNAPPSGVLHKDEAKEKSEGDPPIVRPRGAKP
jgi:predicted Zn-dependent peptidase